LPLTAKPLPPIFLVDDIFGTKFIVSQLLFEICKHLKWFLVELVKDEHRLFPGFLTKYLTDLLDLGDTSGG
jgi:hypothetical protein